MTQEDFIEEDSMGLSIFINPDIEIGVKFALAASKSKPDLVYADESIEKLKEVAGDDLGETEEHEAFFRLPNNEDNTTIVDAAVQLNTDVFKISPGFLRTERVVRLIKRWSFKSSDGKEIPPNRKLIGTLHPNVAAFIGFQLEGQLQSRGLL